MILGISIILILIAIHVFVFCKYRINYYDLGGSFLFSNLFYSWEKMNKMITLKELFDRYKKCPPEIIISAIGISQMYRIASY